MTKQKQTAKGRRKEIFNLKKNFQLHFVLRLAFVIYSQELQLISCRKLISKKNFTSLKNIISEIKEKNDIQNNPKRFFLNYLKRYTYLSILKFPYFPLSSG